MGYSIEEFKKQYNSLNTEQKVAVDLIDGPVMVIAGPGTGKTQILSTRIANIILSGNQTQPENILCLTYTEAGKTAMQKRLIEIIGVNAASKVNIHTFHSFCNKVISEYPECFIFNAQIVDDLSKFEILESLNNHIQEDNILYNPKSDPRSLANMGGYFDNIKKENFDIQDLKRDLIDLKENLHEYKGYHYVQKSHKDFGKLNRIGQQKLDSIDNNIAMLEEYRNYQKLLKSKGFIDFQDMILSVIHVLKTNENVKYDLQEKYQYLLVDEFQDTNGSQFEILQLLGENDLNHEPNIFVVGDDDQSIYRFQGANLKNLMLFKTLFLKDRQPIVLKQNYRSTQNILNASMDLISSNQERLINQFPELTKHLIASKTEYMYLDIQPKIHGFENPTSEMIGTAMQIKELLENGIKPSEIAVLYNKNKTGLDFVAYLKAMDIPYYMHRSENILEDSFAQKLLTLMSYCHKESIHPSSNSDMLFQILAFDLWNINSLSVYKVLNDFNSSDLRYQISFENFLLNYEKVESIEVYQSEVLQVILKLKRLAHYMANNSLMEFINMMINVVEVNLFIFKQDSSFWLIEVLRTIVNTAQEEEEKDAINAKINFFKNLEKRQKYNLPIAAQRISGLDSGINLITYHSSKGLEFEYVFLLKSEENMWEKNKNGNVGLRIPKEIFLNYSSKIESKEEKIEESRRLFYVGLTRAKKQVCVSFSSKDEKGNNRNPTMFVTEILERNPMLKIEHKIIDEKVLYKQELQKLMQAQKIKLENKYINIVKSKVENLKLSVTAINKYLKCPISFYYDSLLRVPTGKVLALDFGTIIHNTLEQFYIQSKSKNEILSLNEILKILNDQIYRVDKNLMNEEEKLLYKHAIYIISNFYEKKLISASLNVSIEKKLNIKFENGLHLTGMIDLIEEYDDFYTIIDYKTGRSKTRKDKLNAPTKLDENVKLNDYWLQGLFYKVLIENSDMNKKPIKDIKFIFVEPIEGDNIDECNISYQQNEIDYAMNIVKNTWQNIQDLKFEEGCNKPECEWCTFEKNRKNGI